MIHLLVPDDISIPANTSHPVLGSYDAIMIAKIIEEMSTSNFTSKKIFTRARMGLDIVPSAWHSLLAVSLLCASVCRGP